MNRACQEEKHVNGDRVLTHITRSSNRHSMRISPLVALDGGIEGEVLPSTDLRPQDVKLGAHPQALPDARHICEDGRPIDARIAARWPQHARQNRYRRRLAGAVVPCTAQNNQSRHYQKKSLP